MIKGYRYTESGLTNVWLANGYTIRKTKYGKAYPSATWTACIVPWPGFCRTSRA